jgi:hypothetical protein
MPIVNVPLAAPAQPRQRGHQLLCVPYLQMFQVKPHFDPLADQPAVHRIHIVLHANQAAGGHGHCQPLARLQTPRRQWSQHGALLGQSLGPALVALPAYLLQERFVQRAAGKVPAAAEQQRLIHRVFEMPMRRLGIAVFVSRARLDLLPHQSVMVQQPLVTLREVAPLRQVVHRAAHPIAAVPHGHASQLPQRVLQAHAQTLETLGEAERHRLPVRVRQHQVIHHVLEGLPGDGHLQAVHVREVGGTQPARMMDLAEVHFLAGSLRGAPLLHAPLQCP